MIRGWCPDGGGHVLARKCKTSRSFLDFVQAALAKSDICMVSQSPLPFQWMHSIKVQ
jgi:hypothetical protein